MTADPRPRRGPLAVIDAYWCAPAPATRLAAVRWLIGLFALVYLAARLPHLLGYAHFDPAQFRPIGVVGLVLDRPLVPLAVQLVTVATVAAAVAFCAGWRFAVTGPVFAALLLWTLTYRNSWGMIFHTENLLVMHVLVLGLSRSADAWSLDARRRRIDPGPAPAYGWPLRLMCWIIVIAYVLAGIAKLRNAGTTWLWGDELRNYVAIDNVRKLLLGDVYSPLAAPLLHHEWLFRLMALATVVLELGAPVALFGRRAALAWVVPVIVFHWGVLALMFIFFPYPITGFAFVCFFPAERLIERVLAVWRRRRSGQPRPSG